MDPPDYITEHSTLRNLGRYGGVVLALVRIYVAKSANLLIVVCFYSFLVIKVMLGVNLVSYATQRRAGMEARAVADVVNDFGRDPIEEGKEEQVRYSTIVMLSNTRSVFCRCTTRNSRHS